MSGFKMPRELRTLLERRPGWTPTRTNGDHIRLTHTSGAIAFTGSTPGDRRSWRNLESTLRRLEQENR